MNKHTFRTLALMALGSLGGATPAHSQLVEKLADRINLHAYAQGGYTYTHNGKADENTFDLKRVILIADAQITPRWSFLFMHNFSGAVQEFYTDYRLTSDKALTVRVGQFKNGLSYENMLSPTVTEAIDCYSQGVSYLAGVGGDPLIGAQSGRDLGVSLFGETRDGRLAYQVGVMNGQGINVKDGNGEKDLIGRVEWRPAPGLNLIATGQLGRGHAIAASPYIATIAAGQDYRRNRWTAGFAYQSGGVSVRAEYVEGRDGDATSRGAYVTGLTPLGGSKCDLVGSYDFFNYNVARGMAQHKAMIGLQYWFYERCRIQAQYVYKSAGLVDGQFTRGANHAIMCQMQVRFN